MLEKGFVFYPSYYDGIEFLSDEQLGQAVRKICEKYFRGRDYICDDKLVDGIAKSFMPNIETSSNRYFACVENGKKGGAPKGNQNAKKNSQNQPKNNLNGYFEEQPKETTENNLKDKDKVKEQDKEQVKEIVPESINTRKQKEYDGTMTVDYSTTTNNQTHNVEKEKEQYDVNILPVTEGTTKKSKEYYIKCFEEGCGKGLEPTVDQITGFVVKNNISFDRKDFETTVYQGYKVGDKYQASLKNLGFSALTKLRPMKVKVEEGGYGYSFSSDTKSVQEFMKMYVESDKHQDLNIIVENNN